MDISGVVKALLSPSSKGQVEKGNIDIFDRPRVTNKDGSVSTVRTISIGVDGKEVLIPTVVGNKVLSDEDAIKEFERTGKHLGKFATPEAASSFAESLHKQQESLYNTPGGGELLKIIKSLGK
jgi:hypothetical protein